jgi:hypothetical protein
MFNCARNMGSYRRMAQPTRYRYKAVAILAAADSSRLGIARESDQRMRRSSKRVMGIVKMRDLVDTANRLAIRN